MRFSLQFLLSRLKAGPAAAAKSRPQGRQCLRRKEGWGSQGFLTVQFLLAFAIVMFFIISFLGLALTLIHGSITQYITYSAARALALGREDKDAQAAAAERVYRELRNSASGRGGLIPQGQFENQSGGGWFYIPPAISKTQGIGYNSSYEDLGSGGYPSGRLLFYGVSVSFISFLTQFKIPGLMSEDSGRLEAVIGSYLGREPTTEECKDFFHGNIFKKHLPESYRNFIRDNGGNFTFTPPDNGC